MKMLWPCLTVLLLLAAHQASAESLRCNSTLVQLGDSKAEVLQKCGEPVLTDSYCENSRSNSQRLENTTRRNQSCENIDIWTYNPGSGKFLTNLYFAQGKLREIRYGDRVD